MTRLDPDANDSFQLTKARNGGRDGLDHVCAFTAELQR